MLLLPVLLLSSTMACGDPGRDGDAIVMRTYDLSSALPWRMNSVGVESLLPCLSPARPGSPDNDAFDRMWGADQVIELLRLLSGQEFEYPGRELSVDGHGRLVVRAPAAVQERTERYLQFLEGVFGATAELAIDAVDLPEGAASLPALIPLADAQKALDSGARRRTWRLQMRAGVTARLDLTRKTSMVVDYNVEIAQGVAIQDPIVHEIPVGTRISARAAPAPGGLWLALILRNGEMLSEVRDRDLQLRFLAGVDSRLDFVDAARTLQTVEVLNRSLAVSAFVPEGRALAIQSAFEVDGKVRSELLLVRRAGGALPVFQRLALDPKSGSKEADVLFVNQHAAEPPRCRIESWMFDSDNPPVDWAQAEFGNEPYTWAGHVEDAFDALREQLRVGDEDLYMFDFGPCLFLAHDPSRVPPPPEEGVKVERPGDPVDLLMRMAPSARVVQVTLALRRPGAKTPAARWVLPLRAGEAAAAVLVAESLGVGDYHVEVAQSAAAADPQVRITLDGLAVQLRPAIALSGEVTLEISARASLRRGPVRELDLRIPTLGPIDQTSCDRLFASEKLAFGKGEGGPRKVILGDASGQDGLSLEVEAIEIR